MSCIKTGFHACVGPYDEYIYGDAFEVDGQIYYFRICAISLKPIRERLHFVIHDFVTWFDKEKTSQQQNSTLIARATKVDDLGYDGIGIIRKEKE